MHTMFAVSCASVRFRVRWYVKKRPVAVTSLKRTHIYRAEYTNNIIQELTRLYIVVMYIVFAGHCVRSIEKCINLGYYFLLYSFLCTMLVVIYLIWLPCNHWIISLIGACGCVYVAYVFMLFFYYSSSQLFYLSIFINGQHPNIDKILLVIVAVWPYLMAFVF